MTSQPPPELARSRTAALGAEVTPSADLYSLGAMLYELVTGRPPFEGDTPTAVISQHLNATPVAPSWYSDRCPPELEALILRLLAKRPEERPASAAEVRAALEAVDPEGRSRSHSDSQANPLERLARGVFVGRELELEQLQGALDAAFQRRGSVVMLVGEPGIGKTRTVQELETYARMRGATVLWGRAHETPGAPAFWPWVQIGNQYSTEHDLTALGPSLPACRVSARSSSVGNSASTAPGVMLRCGAALMRQACARSALPLCARAESSSSVSRRPPAVWRSGRGDCTDSYGSSAGINSDGAYASADRS